MKAIAILLLISACSLPNQHCVTADECRALFIVWTDALDAEHYEAPIVVLHHELCPGTDKTAVVTLDTGKCYDGLFEPAFYHVDVAWRGSFSSSAYAHELIHAYCWITLGQLDGDHLGVIWGREAGINDALHAAGL